MSFPYSYEQIDRTVFASFKKELTAYATTNTHLGTCLSKALRKCYDGKDTSDDRLGEGGVYNEKLDAYRPIGVPLELVLLICSKLRLKLCPAKYLGAGAVREDKHCYKDVLDEARALKSRSS